ncbi:MAG: BtpA/SgcQ family protein, partial [Candidatus Eisenbacteria bacterium]|nr:BtpA/SgcQ family protein [Candidatus Eisenbacteria bacterium]
PRPTFQELFRTSKPVIGVVHLKPLPGSPGYDGSFLALLDHALTDARAIEAGGASGLIVENFGDAPYFPDQVPPETIAAMTRLVTEVRKAVRIPVGVNVLRNDARGGVAVAAATGAGFVRVNVHTGVMVTDQGLIAGRAWESVRLREVLRSRTLLFADIRVKHAVPLAQFDLVAEADDLLSRGRADALIITGASTGSPADLAQVQALKEAFPDVAVMVGSGVDADNAEAVLQVADGCIIGTSIKFDGRVENAVDPERLAGITRVAGRLFPREASAHPRFEEGPRTDVRPRSDERSRSQELPIRFERARPAEAYQENGGNAESHPGTTEIGHEVTPAPVFSSPPPPSSLPPREGGVPIWEPRPMAAAPAPGLVGAVMEDNPIEQVAVPALPKPAAAVRPEVDVTPFGRISHRKKRR